MINYITIEREYGSGATEIGKRLMEKTGIRCYGGEILELAAKRMRKTVEQVLILEEKNLDSINYTLSMIDSAVNGKNEVPDHIKLHTIENDIIRELADEGPAVFIGHCAGHALKDRDDVLNVYIHGSKSFNKFRAIEKYHISPTEVDKIMKKIDRRRANFYNTTTGSSRGSLVPLHFLP